MTFQQFRAHSVLKWLYPGMHIKRWLGLLLLGVALMGLGIASSAEAKTNLNINVGLGFGGWGYGGYGFCHKEWVPYKKWNYWHTAYVIKYKKVLICG